MKFYPPLALAFTTALALQAGCKTDKPETPAAAGDKAAPSKPAGEARPAPPPPSLPPEVAKQGAAAADEPDPQAPGAPGDQAGAGAINMDRLHTRAETMVKRLDTNGDGKLTPDELALAPGRRMRFEDPAAVDTNHDGQISADELATAMKALADRRRARNAAASGSGAPGAPAAPASGNPQ